MTTALALAPREIALAGPVGSLDGYIQAVSAIPILDAETERELARRLRDDNDLDAARELVISHLRFVVHVARSYTGYGLALGDLIQEGNVGLMKAVKRYDPEVGVRLVSFAVHWIRSEIHEFVLRNWRLVKVATTKAQRKLFFNLRKAKKQLGWFSAEETAAVAQDLGVTPAEVTEMEKRLAGWDLSFDPLSASEEDEYAPAAYLASDVPDPAQIVEHADSEQDAHSRLDNGLQTLDERSRDIIKRRWLTEKKSTLHELAAEYNVSAERIRQIEKSALGKLQGLLA